VLAAGFLSACAPEVASNSVVPVRDEVAFLRPRCAGVDSCLLGRVTAQENARPLARAAVFLELQGEAAKADVMRLQTLTDDQGVFTIEDPPPGRYRLAVYKDARSLEVRGLSLGGRGTTLVPVSLAP
jgi:hypothetical protein